MDPLHVLTYLPVLGLSASAVVIGLERLWPARRDVGQPMLNLGLWAVSHVSQGAALPIAAASALALAGRANLPSLHSHDWPLAWAVLTYFLTMDLAEYLFHRAQHAVPWLWRMHSLHHSDPCVSALTTQRHFWGDVYLRAFFIWPLFTIVLAPPGAAIGLYGLFAVSNIFAHANLPVNFGRLSWLLNSPAYHRLHHAKAAEHHSANFAALLPIWDVLTGAYRQPGGPAPATGLDEAPRGLLDMLVWPLLCGPRSNRAARRRALVA